jgi:hypothetical protein
LAKEKREDLTSKQKAAIKRCWLSDDFREGVLPAIRMMQDVENTNLIHGDNFTSVCRAQGGYIRLKMLLDLLQTVGSVEIADNERKRDV